MVIRDPGAFAVSRSMIAQVGIHPPYSQVGAILLNLTHGDLAFSEWSEGSSPSAQDNYSVLCVR